VIEFHALEGKHAADEQVAMAEGRVLLAAHDRDAVLLDSRFQSLDPRSKEWRFGEARVEHIALGIVELCALRPAA
jgi:hypothetical protein